MKAKLLRRIAPAALAAGIGLGAAGATADAAATAAPATNSTYGCVVGPVNSGFLGIQSQATTCTGPNGVATRNALITYKTAVFYLNSEIVACEALRDFAGTNFTCRVVDNFSDDSFLRQLVGLS